MSNPEVIVEGGVTPPVTDVTTVEVETPKVDGVDATAKTPPLTEDGKHWVHPNELEKTKQKLVKLEAEAAKRLENELKEKNNYEELYKNERARVLGFYKTSKLAEAGLDTKLASLVTGATEEEVDAVIATLSETFNGVKSQLEAKYVKDTTAKTTATDGTVNKKDGEMLGDITWAKIMEWDSTTYAKHRDWIEKNPDKIK